LATTTSTMIRPERRGGNYIKHRSLTL